MSEQTILDPLPTEGEEEGKEGIMPTVIYILYLAAAFTGVPWLIGLVLAYLNRGEASDMAASHYHYQIRTFWLGLLYMIVGGITMPLMGLGLLICGFTWVWTIVRSFKGLNWYNDNTPVPDPKTLLW